MTQRRIRPVVVGPSLCLGCGLEYDGQGSRPRPPPLVLCRASWRWRWCSSWLMPGAPKNSRTHDRGSVATPRLAMPKYSAIPDDDARRRLEARMTKAPKKGRITQRPTRSALLDTTPQRRSRARCLTPPSKWSPHRGYGGACLGTRHVSPRCPCGELPPPSSSKL